ncbi:sugar phosphate isomerase/epimerase (plasmid) [Azospirillum sp. TSA2s]|uniref:sugar phosphate isomerase/epimerase family protein n=1 Tax=Azospirillum sp. TSA2s TaxID=709810 RepID=UPI0010A9F35E|nr:sugar phosphate isomerase/epimerase family protein [Azospirillum sp. TSA2s]QCG93043.1 sugar phosphate isomerase/epimerase [Azospirillum sp. TSA2s]
MRGVYVSTGAFTSNDLVDLLRQADELGYRHLELSSGVAFRKDLRDVIEAHRDRFEFMVHNYFPPPEPPFVLNLASTDPAVRERSIEHCRSAMLLAADLGSTVYSVHGGFMVQPQVSDLGNPFSLAGAAPRDQGLALFRDSVQRLLSLAPGIGVRLLIENNVLAPFNAPDGRNAALLMVEAAEMADFARSLDSPWFGYLIDTGHLKVSARTLGFDADDFLQEVSPWIAGFHVSENDGTADTNHPFDEHAWFLPWLGRLRDRFVVIEAYRLTPGQLHLCWNAVQQARTA